MAVRVEAELAYISPIRRRKSQTNKNNQKSDSVNPSATSAAGHWLTAFAGFLARTLG